MSLKTKRADETALITGRQRWLPVQLDDVFESVTEMPIIPNQELLKSAVDVHAGPMPVSEGYRASRLCEQLLPVLSVVDLSSGSTESDHTLSSACLRPACNGSMDEHRFRRH